MDIRSFINSQDLTNIAKHCRAIGHEFTPLETALIVYLSRKPLTERHKAWQEIIDTQPDMKIIRQVRTDEEILSDNLHQFLSDYMRIENNLVDRLKVSEIDTAYSYSKYFTKRAER